MLWPQSIGNIVCQMVYLAPAVVICFTHLKVIH